MGTRRAVAHTFEGRPGAQYKTTANVSPEGTFAAKCLAGAVSAYNVQAVKWEHGWELHVEDVGVTQCRTLATAAQHACDFVATMFDIDADDAEIHLSVAIGGVEKDVERAPRRVASNARRPPNRAASPAGCAAPACPSPTPSPSWTSAKGASPNSSAPKTTTPRVMTTSAGRAPAAHLSSPSKHRPAPTSPKPKQPLTCCFDGIAQVTGLNGFRRGEHHRRTDGCEYLAVEP